MPELGINAVYSGARLVTKLEEFGFNSRPHPGLGSPSLNVGRFAGGLNINSVPDRAEIEIDIRTVPGMDSSRLTEALTSYLHPEMSTLEQRLDLAPVWTDPQAPWVQAVIQIANKTAQATTELRGAPYFTDASVLKSAYHGAPAVILGPGEQDMAHKTDEYCFIDRIEQSVGIYTEVIRDWQTNATHYTAT
jgi:succinyl-diaminopimelate desuccinylase